MHFAYHASGGPTIVFLVTSLLLHNPHGESPCQSPQELLLPTKPQDLSRFDDATTTLLWQYCSATLFGSGEACSLHADLFVTPPVPHLNFFIPFYYPIDNGNINSQPSGLSY